MPLNAAATKLRSLASLHKGIKEKRQEARLCPSCLADPSDVTCKGSGY